MKQHEQALLFFKKASEDKKLLDEIHLSSNVSDEIFGFHCQQAAEKYLKAILSEFGMDFPRTHNLRFLLDILEDAGHPVPEQLAELDILTPYGTLFRYEDIPTGTSLDRRRIAEMLQALRDLAGTILKL